MGTSFVEIDENDERGFWINDGDLHVWLRFLALHINSPSQPGSAATTIRDQWLLASSVSIPGCVPTDLDVAVSTPEGAMVVRSAVTSLLTALEQHPSSIPAGVLNLMGLPGMFFADYSTDRLIEVGHAFLGLLDGTLTTTAGDPPLMPGSPRS